jgi:hypothetical protein
MVRRVPIFHGINCDSCGATTSRSSLVPHPHRRLQRRTKDTSTTSRQISHENADIFPFFFTGNQATPLTSPFKSCDLIQVHQLHLRWPGKTPLRPLRKHLESNRTRNKPRNPPSSPASSSQCSTCRHQHRSRREGPHSALANAGSASKRI